MLKNHYMQSSSLSHFAFENQRWIINFFALNDVFLSLFWFCFVFLYIYIKECIYLAKM